MSWHEPEPQRRMAPNIRSGCSLVEPTFTSEQLTYGAKMALEFYAKAFEPIPKGTIETGDVLYIGGDGRVMRLRGSAYDHSEDYNPTRYQKEKSMKPGPYKSSTHGNITLSERGRTLLQAERAAAQNAIRSGDWSDDGQALSRARGDIALYISHIEGFPVAGNQLEQRIYLNECERQRVAAEQGASARQAARRDAAFAGLTNVNPSLWGRYPYQTLAVDLAAAEPTKEQTMTNQAEAPDQAEKTRSQLLTEATCELCAAQRRLEAIQRAPEGMPETIVVSSYPYSPADDAISTLVKEQWPALVKKAVTRAKARVAKAEKAVSTLLT